MTVFTDRAAAGPLVVADGTSDTHVPMSVFLEVPRNAWLTSNAHAFALPDGHPVSPGHTLVVTRRLVPDWFSATDEERAAILHLIDEVKGRLVLAFRASSWCRSPATPSAASTRSSA
jgi:hypothetical protein